MRGSRKQKEKFTNFEIIAEDPGCFCYKQDRVGTYKSNAMDHLDLQKTTKQSKTKYLRSLRVNKTQAYLKRKLKSEKNDTNPEMTQNLELSKQEC